MRIMANSLKQAVTMAPVQAEATCCRGRIRKRGSVIVAFDWFWLGVAANAALAAAKWAHASLLAMSEALALS